MKRLRWAAGILAMTSVVGGSSPSPAAPAIGDDPSLQRHEFRETHMGSEFKLLLYTATAEEATTASRAAFDRIAALNRAFSDYDPDSEVMKLCERSGGPPVTVSADLFDIIDRSLTMNQRSGGVFDITIGPVGRLWRRARRDRKLPDRDRLDEALRKVGSDKIRLDREARTVELARPGMKLDLGGIAKGYACQEALAVLEKRGIHRALVSGAGDIAMGDAPPDASGWRIGVAPVENPEAADPRLYLVVRRCAVSTSGDAERFVEIDGKRYSHIVDPRTGVGVIDRASVTVVAPDGGTADSLATAVYLLGPDRGLALVDAVPGCAAIFFQKVDDREVRTASSRWNDLEIQAPDPSKASPITP